MKMLGFRYIKFTSCNSIQLWDCDGPPSVRNLSPFGRFSVVLKSLNRFVSAFGEWWCNLCGWNGLSFSKPRLRSGSGLEYESRVHEFESYSGNFHSNKLSRLKGEFQLSVIPGKKAKRLTRCGHIASRGGNDKGHTTRLSGPSTSE